MKQDAYLGVNLRGVVTAKLYVTKPIQARVYLMSNDSSLSKGPMMPPCHFALILSSLKVKRLSFSRKRRVTITSFCENIPNYKGNNIPNYGIQWANLDLALASLRLMTGEGDDGRLDAFTPETNTS